MLLNYYYYIILSFYYVFSIVKHFVENLCMNGAI